MSAPSGTVWQSNFKVGNGGLHNVYADSLADYLDQLDAFAEQVLPKLIAIEQTIAAGSVVAQSLPVSPASTQTITAQPPVSEQSDAGGHSCMHGPMRHVPAGISKKTGKPYPAFWTCSAGDRNCKNIGV